MKKIPQKKTDQMIDELLKFVRGKPNEEKKKIAYAYFEKHEYEKTKEITLMKWNKQFEYPKSMRSLINDERHYEVGSEKLPSVTTILSGYS
jgi:hypothetical protein